MEEILRKLAEKTVQATTEVDKAVRDIQQVTGENIRHVEQTVEAIVGVSALAESSGRALTEIVAMSEESSDKVRRIATAAEEQSLASEEITRSIGEVSVISGKVSEAMRESGGTLRELVRQAEALEGEVRRLKG